MESKTVGKILLKEGKNGERKGGEREGKGLGIRKKPRKEGVFFPSAVQPSKDGVNELLRAASASAGEMTCRLPPLMVAGDAVDMKMGAEVAEVEVVGAVAVGAEVVVDVVVASISIPSLAGMESSSSISRSLSSSMRLS